MFPPQRIVCLTEETVETLYLLGEQDRIVGISGYCVRPPEARRQWVRLQRFSHGRASGRNRRIPVVGRRAGGRRLTKPMAGARSLPRGLLIMPQMYGPAAVRK
jgi:hypothetical protein